MNQMQRMGEGDFYEFQTYMAWEADSSNIGVQGFYSNTVSNDGKEATVFASYYKDLESYDGTGCDGETRELRIDWSDFASKNGVKVTYRLIDKEHDGDIVSEETFFGSSGAHILKLPLYTSVLVTLTKL